MAKIYNASLVQGYIRKRILEDGLKPGDSLPPEGEIAATLEISRGSVREAVRALEGIGLIEVRHGTGLILRNFNMDAFIDIFTYGILLDPTAIINLYEIRRMLESSVMPEVVEKATQEVVDKCEAILLEWEGLVREGKAVYEHDRLFHETLYSPLGNKMLTELCNIFWYAFRNAEIKGFSEKARRGDEYDAMLILAGHRRILDAVKRKDVAAATTLMSEHFKGIEKRLELSRKNIS